MILTPEMPFASHMIRPAKFCIVLLFCLFSAGFGHAEGESPEKSRSVSFPDESPGLPFGRLFTTPQERTILDRRRQQPGSAAASKDNGDAVANKEALARPADNAAAVSTPAQPLKLSGIVIRADGMQQLWVNGKLQPPQKKSAGEQRYPGESSSSASLRVPVKQQNHITTLKPGQVWSPGSETITESYQQPPIQPPKAGTP